MNKKLLLSVISGCVIGFVGIFWYQENTYKGMWQQHAKKHQLPKDVFSLVSTERFNEILIQEYSDGNQLFTVLTDCDLDTCHIYQSARERGTRYTGNGYAVVRSNSEGILVFAEGKFTNSGEFEESILDNLDRIESALN